MTASSLTRMVATVILTALLAGAPAAAAIAEADAPPPSGVVVGDPTTLPVEPSEPQCICATTPDYGDADFSNEPGLDLPPQPGSEPAPYVFNPPPMPDLSEYMRAQWEAERASGASQVGTSQGSGGGDAVIGDATAGDAVAASAAATEILVAAPRVTALPRDAQTWRWLQQAPGSLRSTSERATAAFEAKGAEVQSEAAADEADSLRNRLLMVGLLVVLIIVSLVLLRLHGRRARG